MTTLSFSRGSRYILGAKDGITFPTPPAHLVQRVGGGDFHAVGEHFMMLLQDVCGLEPDSSVLDLGAGCGRMAVPLSRYLASTARYQGLDIDMEMVEWCRTHLEPHLPHFRFHHAGLRNDLYSESGADAATYRFPFNDGEFDFALAASLFTHLRPPGMRQYIRELARVLAPGGSALTTWFLLHPGNAGWGFEHEPGECRVMDTRVPEATIAYTESIVLAQFREVGLLVDQVSYGTWSGARGLSYQDLVKVHRP